MSREWQPGDVALGRYPIWGSGGSDTTYEEMRLVRFAEGWARADDPDDFVRDDNRTQYIEARPLVVIDPEDREQINRLLGRLSEMSFSGWACGATDCLQVALREFADPKPPKPEEPTGLGAVIEDAEGNRYIRYGASLAPWIACASNEGMDPDRPYRYWSGIDAVRVLSEGVMS